MVTIYFDILIHALIRFVPSPPPPLPTMCSEGARNARRRTSYFCSFVCFFLFVWIHKAASSFWCDHQKCSLKHLVACYRALTSARGRERRCEPHKANMTSNEPTCNYFNAHKTNISFSFDKCKSAGHCRGIDRRPTT